MIRYLDSDLFSSQAQTWVNPVNLQGIMGAGLAELFRIRFPEMFREYQGLCLRQALRPGLLHLWKGPERWVLNFPTKLDWRKPAHLDQVEASLKSFQICYEGWGIESVAFPALGCGLGRLRWEEDVRPLMERMLGNLPIKIDVHLPRR